MGWQRHKSEQLNTARFSSAHWGSCHCVAAQHKTALREIFYFKQKELKVNLAS